MNVLVSSEQADLDISPAQVKTLIKTLLDMKGIACDEIGIHFVDINRISALHNQFFNDPTPTDCLSLPIDSPNDASVHPCVLGDIFVCPAIAKSYAEHHQLDPYAEVTLYIVHGFLHLLGYDDSKASVEKEMRDEEKKCIVHLESHQMCLCSVGS